MDSCLDRTGMGPGELLNCHGLFAVPATAADCTYLTPEERKLLGMKGVSAVCTPVTAYKNGQRSTPILESVQAGMNVALGTDGAIECGNLDRRVSAPYARPSPPTKTASGAPPFWNPSRRE